MGQFLSASLSKPTMHAPWNAARRMSTRSPAAFSNDVQTYSNQRNSNASAAPPLSATDLGEVLSRGNGNTIHIHMNCNSGNSANNDGSACGGAFNGGYPAVVPSLPGLWPLPPFSYGNGYFPPGVVFGCPPGPVLLPPMMGQCGGAFPTGW